MDLSTATATALALTGELTAALNTTSLDACAALLVRRGAAMAALQTAHEAAKPAERESCRPEISLLAAADHELRKAAAAALAAASQNLRSQSAASASRGRVDESPSLACLDRRA